MAQMRWPMVRTRCPLAQTRWPLAQTWWPMARTRWPMARTRWPMARTRWPLAQTRWPLAQTRWPLAQTRWPMAQARCPLAQVRWPMARTRWPMARMRLSRVRMRMPPAASHRDASYQPGVKPRGAIPPKPARVLQGRLMRERRRRRSCARSPHEASRWDAVSPAIRSRGFTPGWYEPSPWDEDPFPAWPANTPPLQTGHTDLRRTPCFRVAFYRDTRPVG